MSTSHRRLQVDVVGNVSGFMAAMNQLNLGTSRFHQNMQKSTKEAGLFQKQLMAIGTTARYSLAGALVFGVTGAISKLGEFKAQLGAIDAVAGQVNRQGHFKSIGSQLNEVGKESILLSNQLGIAVTDVEAYMQRFYSSFRVPPGAQGLKEAQRFVSRVAMLQSQFGAEAGDPQMLAGGVAGLIHSMPGGTRNIGGNTALVANLISNLVAQTPNITGRDVARDIGRIGSTQQIARMTPQQAFATWGVAGMAGGSSSVIGRGIAQLLSASLLHPTSPVQKAEFAKAGLSTDPTTLRKMGGFNVLLKLLQYVGGPNPRVGNRTALTSEDIEDPVAAVNAAKTRNINLTALYNLFGRQESVRQFVNLLGQGGVKAMQEWMNQQRKAIKVDQQRERFNAAIQQQTLRRFTQARQNLSMQLVAGMDWPLEHLIANPTIAASNLAAKHPTATQGAVVGALSLGAANMLRRSGVFGTAAAGGTGKGFLGRFGKFMGVANAVETGAISQAIKKEELPAAIAGQVADGTRANPFWVIVSPMSRTVGGIPDPMSPLDPTDPSNAPGKKNWWSKVGSRLKRFGTAGGIAAGAARRIPLAGAAAIAGVASIPELFQLGYDLLSGDGRQVPKGHPLLERFGQPVRASALAFQKKPTGLEQRILDRFASGTMSADMAERRLAAIETMGKQRGDVQTIQVQGSAKGEFTVKLVDASGHVVSVVRERGVPVKVWSAPVVPTSKGRPKKK